MASSNEHPAPIIGLPEETLRELRVRLRPDLHRRLIAMKVLRGMSLAETISTALDVYFEAHGPALAEAAARATPARPHDGRSA